MTTVLAAPRFLAASGMKSNPVPTAAPPAEPSRARKWRRAAELKAVRGRLQSGSGIEPEFEHELMAIFARNELKAAVTMPVLAVIFSLASTFWASKHEALVWLTLVIVSKALLLWQCGRYLADADAHKNIKRWRRVFVSAEILTGVCWAGFVLVGMDIAMFANWFDAAPQPSISPTALFTASVFIFAALIVVISVRMTFAATIPSVLYAGTLPMTLAVVVRLVVVGDPFLNALAAMAVGVHLYFIWLVQGLYSTALERLTFRAQKDILIAALEEEKAISDEARRRAEAANNSKSRFLATMSHELRTPLNAIMGFSEVMKAEVMGPLGTPVYKEYSGNIHDSGRHLLNLINEILDLSRIEAGRYQLTEERLRLTDVVDDCHRLLKLRAEAKGLTLTLELADDLPPVWADQRALRQICLNLMSNALKFTPKGGTITVKITNAPGGGQMLSVRDTGPGIPADEIPKVMQPFGQGSLAHQTAEGGTGLGLSIVTSLVELHDGKFELRSELRRGTEAIVILPQRRVLAAAPPLQPLGAERHRLNPELRARIQRPPAAPHAKPGASHPGNAASQPAKAALQSAHAAHPASQPSPERKPAPRRARLRDVLRA
ncbi:MAG: ATP-binding protein [Hyphomicrobium aestuarii]|nr:ATP-binding protein [Hyphomicrobium aestuarii]